MYFTFSNSKQNQIAHGYNQDCFVAKASDDLQEG